MPFNTFPAAPAVLPAKALAKAVTGGPITMFTITGRVLVTALWGAVSTVIGAGATSILVRANPTTGADTDLCTNGVITTAPVNSLVAVPGTFANALSVNLATQGAIGSTTIPIIINPGTLEIVVTGGTTGAIDWYCSYLQMDAGAGVS